MVGEDFCSSTGLSFLFTKGVVNMFLETEHLTKDHRDIDRVNQLYLEAFPDHERMPMNILLRKANKRSVDFWALYDQNIFVGFTYLITHQDLTYVLYVAVDGQARSSGYGSQLLKKIEEHRPGNRIILNIENLDESAENYQQRVTRKKFYVRNGYRDSGLVYEDRWAKYEVLLNGTAVETHEFYRLLRKFAGNLLFLLFKPRITKTNLNR